MSKKRPMIHGIINPGTGTLESFQNEIIRPIIKMQHDILIVSFKHYLGKRKIDFSSVSLEIKKHQIASIFSKDTSYRNLLLGITISHFTKEEFEEYSVQESEYNRRILQILKNRILDSISEL